MQQLAVAFRPGDFVAGSERGAVPDIEVAGGVFRRRIQAVLRLPGETVQRTVVEAMPVGIPNGEVETVGEPLGQGCLQAVVVGVGVVLHVIDEL